MQFDGIGIDLATIFGVAIMVYVSMEVVKRLLKLFYLKDKEPPRWYDFVLYISAYVIGVIWAFVGLVIIESRFGAATNAEAVVKGVLGGFIAVAGYSGWQNVKKLRQPQE